MDTGQFVATTLVAALLRVSEQAINDAYSALKVLLQRRFSDDDELQKMIERVETDPQKWQDTMILQLDERAEQLDSEIIQATKTLQSLLNKQSNNANMKTNIQQKGSGNIATGGSITGSTIKISVEKGD